MPVRPAQGSRSSDFCSLTCTCTGRFYRYDLQSRARKIIPRRSLVRSVRPVTSNSGMFSREAASAPSYGHLSVPYFLLADAVSKLLRLRVSSISPLLRQAGLGPCSMRSIYHLSPMHHPVACSCMDPSGELMKSNTSFV